MKVLQPDMLREAQRWTMNYREGVATRYEAKVGQNLEGDDTDKYYRVPVGATFIPQGEPPPRHLRRLVRQAVIGQPSDSEDDQGRWRWSGTESGYQCVPKSRDEQGGPERRSAVLDDCP